MRTPEGRSDDPEESAESLTLAGEEARVRKERVEREARASVRVVQEPATLEVQRLREHFRVTKEPLERTSVGYRIREPQVLTLPIREERVRVEKRSVVVEEAALRKRSVESSETIRTTIRREELDRDPERRDER